MFHPVFLGLQINGLRCSIVVGKEIVHFLYHLLTQPDECFEAISGAINPVNESTAPADRERIPYR